LKKGPGEIYLKIKIKREPRLLPGVYLLLPGVYLLREGRGD